MIKKLLLGLILLFTFSCDKEDNSDALKDETGTVWISGGLAYCAHQIKLDNGNSLIVKIEDIGSYKSGDRVIVKYKEIGANKFCSPNLDCEIIEIDKL